MLKLLLGYIKEVKESWQGELKVRAFINTGIFSVVSLLPLIIYLNPYLEYIEQRPGYNLDDFMLKWLPVLDVSDMIFILLYMCSLVMFLFCIQKPWLFLRGLQTFILLQYLRNVCLYVTPLDAPIEIIPLQDPVLSAIAYSHKPNLKDLFFSGHTATMVIFVLLSWKRPGHSLILAIITIVMAILLLIQHCHYTIDIFGGIVFAWLSYKWIHWFWEKIQLPIA